MNFYREAAIALRQNVRPVSLFVLVNVLLSGVDVSLQLFVLRPNAGAQSLGLELVGWQILYIALSAVAQSIFFARIGREMDKPMWRIPDDREALGRFFRLWFLLGLLTLVYLDVMGLLLPPNADVATAIAFLASVYTLATLASVFGAFVMFYGRPSRQEVREAASTMGRHLGVILAICLFGIMAGLVVRDFGVSALDLAKPAGHAAWYNSAAALSLGMAAGAIDSLVGCFIFAYAWLVCIYDRDHYEQPGDDFDF